MKEAYRTHTKSKLGLVFCVSSVLAVSACGGGGDVSRYNSNRVAQILNEGTASEVHIYARATDYDQAQGVSTSGRAEVIYESPFFGGSNRIDRSQLMADALLRARQGTGCLQSKHTHTQESLRGTHVMIALIDCPPMSR